MMMKPHMIIGAVPVVALGLVASIVSNEVRAGVEPVVLGSRQMDSVTASAPAVLQTEPATRRLSPLQSGEADALVVPSTADMGANWMSVTLPGMVDGGDVVTLGTQGGADNSTLHDRGRVSGGLISRSLTSAGPDTAATSSATAFGTGTAAVFISTTTASAPVGLGVPSVSSSFARASSLGAR